MSDEPIRIKCQGFEFKKKTCDKDAIGEVFKRYCARHYYMGQYSDFMLEELTKCVSCDLMHYSPRPTECRTCIDNCYQANLKFCEEVLLCSCPGCIKPRSRNKIYCIKHEHLAVQVKKDSVIESREEMKNKNFITFETVDYCRSLGCINSPSANGFCKKVHQHEHREEANVYLVSEKIEANPVVEQPMKSVDVIKKCVPKLGVHKVREPNNVVGKPCDPTVEQPIKVDQACSCVPNRIIKKKTNRKNKDKCKGFDRNKNKCRNYSINETEFCDYHDYMIGYTEYMLAHLTNCSDCKKMYYFVDTSTCQKCLDRGKAVRIKNRQQQIMCIHCGENQKSADNDYCGKHQTEYWKAKVESSGKKVCVNYVRGCRAELELDYKYTRCQVCLEKEKIKDYSRSAVRKDIFAEFTDDQFKKFFRDNCFYCGKNYDALNFNGIDRLYSKGAYIDDNCVSCCKMCNFIKGFLDPVVFMMRCEHILTFQGVLNGKLHYDLIPDNIPCSYNDYQLKAKEKKLEFIISQKFYNQLRLEDCYICGKEASGFHKNGIDRFDSNIGYENDNCRPCCTECNFMKNKHSFDIFINQLEKIYAHLNDGNKIRRVAADRLKRFYDKVKNNNIIISMKLMKEQPIDNHNIELRKMIMRRIKN